MAALLREPSAGFPGFPDNLSCCSPLPVQTLFIVWEAPAGRREGTVFPPCASSTAGLFLSCSVDAGPSPGRSGQSPKLAGWASPVPRMLRVGLALTDGT